MSWWQEMMGEPTSVPKNSPSVLEGHTLALYKYNSCPYCMRVLRVIEDLGVEVEMRDIMADRSHRDSLREQTGRTSVPCLYIDGEPLFESADIVAWLRAYAKRAA